ncbi:hypothetical protein DFQ30_011188, partial [Apophysomyces sp. BC1015]
FEYRDIPADLVELAQQWRDRMVEAAAEASEALLGKYLEDHHSLTEQEIKDALRQRTIANEIVPMLCGSAFKNKGVQAMLDAVIDYLPSPVDVPAILGHTPDDDPAERHPADDEPFSALAFKIMTDPFVGQLIFFRVYSGVVNSGDTVLNSTKGKKERIGRILQMHANERTEIKEVRAGDIAAAVGLKEAATGDTLCAPNNAIILERMIFPEPVISQALHLEILVERMKREFNVEATVGKPQVAYRETVRNAMRDVEGKFVKQSGGRGQYGHAVIALEPREPGNGYEFVDAIKGGVIPREFIPAVERGIREAMQAGVLAGYPVVDIKVTLTFGSYHDVDSNENAFRMAGSIAFKEGMRRAQPVLLEPVMAVEVETPEDFMGNVMGDLTSRRGIVQGMEDIAGGGGKVVRAEVPLAEMFGYSTTLRSLTQGRATYTMEFKHYAETPRNVADAVINANDARAQRTGKRAPADHDAVAGCDRILHAGAGHDDCQYRAARDGAQPRRIGIADAIRGHCVFADDGADDPGLRFSCRPVRHPARVLQRDTHFHARLADVRERVRPVAPRRVARGPGRRRCDATAGRAACRAAQLPARALFAVAVPGLVGPLIGPTLGGWLTDVASWHWVFLINVPVGILGCVATALFMLGEPLADAGRFDVKGYLMLVVAMLALTLALDGLAELRLAHALVLVLLMLTFACLTAYGLHATRSPHPLFSLKLFRIHTFSVGLLGNLFARIGSGAMPYLLPLLLQVSLGYTPFHAGLMMLPVAAAGMVSKRIVTALITLYGYRRVLLANTVMVGLTTASFALMSPQQPLWARLVQLAIFGSVNSMQFTAMNTLTLKDLDHEGASSGNSLFSLVQMLSMSLGVTIAGAMLATFTSLFERTAPSQTLPAFHATFVCVGVITALSAWIFGQLAPDIRRADAQKSDTQTL